MTKEISTPCYQVEAGETYKINFETTARQVKFGDGQDLETRFNLLQRKAGGGALSAASVEGLQSINASMGQFCIVGNELYIRLASAWAKVADLQSMGGA